MLDQSNNYEYVFTCPLCGLQGMFREMKRHILNYGMAVPTKRHEGVCAICGDTGGGLWTGVIHHCFTAHTDWEKILTTKALSEM